MPFANFKVPAGSLTAEQKELIVHRTTDLYAEVYGEEADEVSRNVAQPPRQPRNPAMPAGLEGGERPPP